MTTTISMAVGPDDIPGILLLIIFTVGPFVTCLIGCCDREPETGQGYNAAAAGQRSHTTPGSQLGRPAPAAARVMEPQQLTYFSYPAAADAEGGRGTAGVSVVVCAICLEALVAGAECSEVPACRHVFHRGCLVPLCRSPIVPGSEPLSAAEAMV